MATTAGDDYNNKNRQESGEANDNENRTTTMKQNAGGGSKDNPNVVDMDGNDKVHDHDSLGNKEIIPATTADVASTATAPATIDTTTRNNNHNKNDNAGGTAIRVDTRRLYIGNLHARVSQVHLESLLTKRHLAVEQVQFIRPASTTTTTGANNQFAFCTLASKADAARAIQLLHGRKLMGRSLVVQPAHQQQSHSSSSSSASQGATRSSSGSSTRLHTNTGRERRQLDDQIQAIRQKLKQK